MGRMSELDRLRQEYEGRCGSCGKVPAQDPETGRWTCDCGTSAHICQVCSRALPTKQPICDNCSDWLTRP